jgi:hypothetical protein
MFGRGRVAEVQGRGDAQKVVVQFDRVGIKSLVVKYANLRPV